ncbi:MAG: hypothetical protein QXI19_10915 [Candidatus Caldarchaeum sp.]
MAKPPVDLDKSKGHRGIRHSIYVGVRWARRVRHWLKAEKKVVFDVESDPQLWDKPLRKKAEVAGMTEEEYAKHLNELRRYPVVKLGILIMRVENDFLENWWRNIKRAEEMAETVKDILLVEKEKQMGIKRIVETGRLIFPDLYAEKRKKEEKTKTEEIIEIKPVED